MRSIRIGVIGVGIIGKVHLENYARISGVEVAAICDIDNEELHRVGERFHIPMENRYMDFRKMIGRDDLDAIDVCLHNNLHAPAAIAALQAGKHVYCEKPIAGTYADGKAIVETAMECGKKLHVQLASLYEKETKAAKKIIDAGKLGHIYHARSTGYRRRGRPYVDGYGSENFVRHHMSGGGALYDMGVYHIAQILYLLGMPKVERVTGKIFQETAIDPVREEYSGYNVEELGTGYVNFADGLTMDIVESWAIHLNTFEGSSIAGSEGGLRLQPLSFHSTFLDLEMDSTFNLDSMNYRLHTLGTNADAYDSSQQHWIAALQGRVELLPTAEIALQTMLIQEGIYLSTKLGREVSAEEIVSLSKSTALDI